MTHVVRAGRKRSRVSAVMGLIRDAILLLCVASLLGGVVWWIRSFRHTDQLHVYYETPETATGHFEVEATLEASRGGLGLQVFDGHLEFIPNSKYAPGLIVFTSTDDAASGGAVHLYPNSRLMPSPFFRIFRWNGTKDYSASFHGFIFEEVPLGLRYTCATVPFWFICCVFAFPTSLRSVGSFRRGMRLRKGFCIKCGYDLRGGEALCPECAEPARPRPVAPMDRAARRRFVAAIALPGAGAAILCLVAVCHGSAPAYWSAGVGVAFLIGFATFRTQKFAQKVASYTPWLSSCEVRRRVLFFQLLGIACSFPIAIAVLTCVEAIW